MPHPVQVRVSFADTPLADLIGIAAPADDDGTVTITSLAGRPARRVRFVAPDAGADFLTASDVTSYRGGALVLCNDRTGLLAVATGPAAPPATIDIEWGVVELVDGNGHACPSECGITWRLFDVTGEGADAA